MVGGSGAKLAIMGAIRDGSFVPSPLAKPGREREHAEATRMSVEDASALQGFPRNYPWQGTKTEVGLQVGNSIPPPLAGHLLRGLI